MKLPCYKYSFYNRNQQKIHTVQIMSKTKQFPSARRNKICIFRSEWHTHHVTLGRNISCIVFFSPGAEQPMNQHFRIPGKQTQLILKVAWNKNLPNLHLVLKYLQRGMKVQLRSSILSITWCDKQVHVSMHV